MKKLIALFMLMALPVMAQTPAYWWKMTSADTTNVTDWTSGRNAVYMPSVGSGPVLQSAVSGYFQFDGVASYLNCGVIDFGGATNFLLSMWINPSLGDGSSQYMPFGNSSLGSIGAVNIDIYHGTPCPLYEDGYQIMAEYTVPTESWSHIVYYFTGDMSDVTNNKQTYVNGVRLAAISASGSPHATMSTCVGPVSIGAESVAGYNFPGYIDDVRIYTNGVNATTPAALYAAGRTPDSSAPTPVAKPFMLPMRMKNGSVTAIHRRAGTTTTIPEIVWPLYSIWESSIMTASNAPSPYKVTTSDVTAGGLEGWNAFDNSVLTRWQSAASAYPHWIKYDCGVGVSQTVVSLIMRFYPAYNINAFTLSGSMDDSTYTTLITSNAVNNQYLDQLFTNSTPAAYRYYKINGTSGTDANYALMTEAHLSSGLYFPPLTSDTGPSPYAASASSTNHVPVTPSYFAFDYNHHSTNTWASDGSAFPQWIKFDAGSLVKVNGFQLWNIGGNGMSNCVFAASTDNSSWTDLQTINALDVTLGVDTMQTFTNANTTAYRYYRWTINSTYAPSHTVQVNELRLLRYQ